MTSIPALPAYRELSDEAAPMWEVWEAAAPVVWLAPVPVPAADVVREVVPTAVGPGTVELNAG